MITRTKKISKGWGEKEKGGRMERKKREWRKQFESWVAASTCHHSIREAERKMVRPRLA